MTSSTLSAIYAHMLARARATHKLQSTILKGRARLVVLVDEHKHVAVTIGRKGVRVGDVEEQTFKRIFEIPATAKRLPKSGQSLRRAENGDEWHILGWTWREQ